MKFPPNYDMNSIIEVPRGSQIWNLPLFRIDCHHEDSIEISFAHAAIDIEMVQMVGEVMYIECDRTDLMDSFPYTPLKLGYTVIGLDRYQKWYHGYISGEREVNGMKEFRLHWIGFKHNWDDWIPVRSERLLSLENALKVGIDIFFKWYPKTDSLRHYFM